MVKEKVLIAGGAGYIGSVLTGKLLNDGYKVTCLDNLMFNQSSLLAHVHDPNFAFVYGDARNENKVGELVKENDVIIPLAALVGMPLCNLRPWEAEQTNKNAIIMLNKIRSREQI